MSPGAGPAGTAWTAPAKLTVSLRVAGIRDDGYHLLEAEMVSLDLADLLDIVPVPAGEAGLEVVADWPDGAGEWRDLSVGAPADNLVARALAAVGRTAPLTVCFIPEGLAMGDRPVDEARVVASMEELAAVGVDWVAVSLPGDTRAAQRAAIDRFAGSVLSVVAGV